MKQLKDVCTMCGHLFWWLAPVSILLLALILPAYFFGIDFIAFVKTTIWPVTILVILFFFKEVFTYLFFSMKEFNFFGIKGTLRNVIDVINERVENKFIDGKNEKERGELTNTLAEEIKEREVEIAQKDAEIKKTKGDADENLELARDILKEWKDTKTKYQKIVAKLEEENRRLKEQVSSFSLVNVPNITPESLVADLGTGERVEDLTPGNPKK